MGGTSDELSKALEDIAYLARSENRVRVLEALTGSVPPPGQPKPGYQPSELKDITGTSRTTLSRILNEFEDRGLAGRNTDGEYVVTPVGEHVSAEFNPLIESMETIRRLGDAVAIIPTSELTGSRTQGTPIALHDFRDATVRKPDSLDPTFFGRYFADLVEGARKFRWMVYVATPQKMLTATEKEVLDGNLNAEGVFSRSVVDHIRSNPEVGPRREHLRSDNVKVFRFDGHIPCNLFVVDETVLIENSQVGTVADGTLIESQNELVRAWALDVIDRYRAQSDLVKPKDFV